MARHFEACSLQMHIQVASIAAVPAGRRGAAQQGHEQLGRSTAARQTAPPMKAAAAHLLVHGSDQRVKLGGAHRHKHGAARAAAVHGRHDGRCWIKGGQVCPLSKQAAGAAWLCVTVAA